MFEVKETDGDVATFDFEEDEQGECEDAKGISGAVKNGERLGRRSI